MNPELFGWQHFTYLSVCIILMVLGICSVKKYVKSDKTLVLIIKLVALALLISILINRYVQVQSYDNWLYMLPNTYCGLSSTVLALSVLLTKRDSVFLHFIVYLGFIGGVLTLIYPDFIGQANSLFYMPTFSGLLHHTIMTFLILLMAITGYFKPSIKKWYCVPLGLTCFMTWGLFLYDIVGIGAMQIGNSKFEGISGLNWFNVGIIFLAAYFVFIIS